MNAYAVLWRTATASNPITVGDVETEEPHGARSAAAVILRRAALRPLPVQVPPVQDIPVPEVAPQDTWWALEDLWTRLAMHCKVTVEVEGDSRRVVVHRFRQEPALEDLRPIALDPSPYRWHVGGVHGSFVTQIDERGDQFVFTLATARQVESWPEGPDLVWQVGAFLLRLAQRAVGGA